jgi:hypothetical protein
MNARRRRTFLAGAVAIVLVALLVAAGMSLANGGRDPNRPRFVSTAASKRAAHRDDRLRIAEVTLPAWAERVSARSPLAAPRLRGRYPYFQLYSPHETSSTAFFSFRGGPRAALRWFLDHRPAGSEHVYRAAGPTRADKVYRCLSFQLVSGRPDYGERQLVLCAVKSHGRTSVRVDAISAWLEGRSRFERIPRGSRYMEVVVSEGGGSRRSTLVDDPARIDPIVDLVNSLPILQHDTCVPGLDEPSRSTPRVEVLFRSSRGGWPIARIAGELRREGVCPPLLFSLRGRNERSLDEGWIVFQALHGPIGRLRGALERRPLPPSDSMLGR